MLKPKMVFTVLAVWFFFHIIIFWFMNPMSVEALIEGEKGQMSSRTLGYLSGSLCIMVGVIMVLLRDLDITRAKRVLLGIGISLVITDNNRKSQKVKRIYIGNPSNSRNNRRVIKDK